MVFSGMDRRFVIYPAGGLDGVADRVTFIESDQFDQDIPHATRRPRFTVASVNKRLKMRSGTSPASPEDRVERLWSRIAAERDHDAGSIDAVALDGPGHPRGADVDFVPMPELMAVEMLQLAGQTLATWSTTSGPATDGFDSGGAEVRGAGRRRRARSRLVDMSLQVAATSSSPIK